MNHGSFHYPGFKRSVYGLREYSTNINNISRLFILLNKGQHSPHNDPMENGRKQESQ